MDVSHFRYFTYYFEAIVIGGLTLGAFLGFFSNDSIDNFSETQFAHTAIPFGLVSVYLLYFILKRKWKKEALLVKDEIQDIGISLNDYN